MKKFLAAFLAGVILVAAGLAEAKYQKGYYRKNGTYVSGHYKTRGDSSKLNNYSTKGNYNPYSGKKGYTNPYKMKPYRSKKYRFKG